MRFGVAKRVSMKKPLETKLLYYFRTERWYGVTANGSAFAAAAFLITEKKRPTQRRDGVTALL